MKGRFTLMIVACALWLGVFTTMASAQVTVSTSLPNVPATEDALTSGTLLTVRVAVTANTSGFAPSAASFRVYFNDAAVQFQSVVEQDLGPVFASPTDELDPVRQALPPPSGEDPFPFIFRDVATVGPTTFPASNMMPVCFDVVFLVLAGAATEAPYKIDVAIDPGTDEVVDGDEAPLPYFSLAPPGVGTISSVSFDNTLTQFTSEPEWSLLDE